MLTKTKQWLLASLVAAPALFAQPKNDDCCQPVSCCDQRPVPQINPAYNAPAGIKINCGTDWYVTADFIYWQALQENMELGFVANANSNAVTNVESLTTSGAFHAINYDFGYKPGFKIGAGFQFDQDDWEGYAEYTWFHGTKDTSSIAGEGEQIYACAGHPVVQGNSALSTVRVNETPRAFTSAASSWDLKMDFADASMLRNYYVGKQLSFSTYYGVRGAWIRQKRNAFYTGSNGDGSDVVAHDKTTSWAVGPRARLDTNWLIGCGFSLFGDVAADLLYTRYSLSNATKATSILDTEIAHLGFRQKGLNYLRPHAELELGFAYGTYFSNFNWHLDLQAGYGFQAFWNQNMFRKFISGSAIAQSIASDGDLYVHGARFTARLDF